MGTPKGLFNHRASLAWEWEGPRFRGWRALTLHHASRLYGWLIDVAQAPHTHHGRYHHDSRL